TLSIFYHSSVYVYSTPMFNYSFPLAFYLLISESYVPSGIFVNFTYVIIQSNTILPPHVVTYDRVFIPIPQLQSAYIIINNATTPNETGLFGTIYLGDYLDAELVWGGYGYGESTEFLNMSSYLALMYRSGNSWIPFKVIYDFGKDTAESTQDLHETISNNGDAYVSVGYPDYGLLTNNFNPAIPGFLFLNITSKIPFIINSTKTTRFVGYVNYPTKIYFFKNYTINSSSFVILNQPSMITIKPSSYFRNITITPNYTYYYLVTINNISNWYKEGTTITLLSNIPIPYYMVGEYIGTYNTSPGSTIFVNRPIVETLVEHLNYLVIGFFVVFPVAMGIAIAIKVKD
ncbi:MAG: thermopsin family protease, partial [Sulfolobus sp.]|nr:thermopsin family protease [Sulfolobus sp.]